MTSFPGSPKVQKGAIVGIDIFNPVSSVTIFQYNPEQLSRSIAPNYSAAGGGSIVNISSNVAFGGYPHRSPYAAAKWGLIGLTKTWAMELGPEGIRVNALCPGSVEGPRIDGVIERDAALRGMRPEEIREAYKRQSSMRLFVEPEDVAHMVTFLCSDRGATISGQAIGIDGHTETLGTASIPRNH